jgi:hypothetical protein
MLVHTFTLINEFVMHNSVNAPPPQKKKTSTCTADWNELVSSSLEVEKVCFPTPIRLLLFPGYTQKPKQALQGKRYDDSITIQ